MAERWPVHTKHTCAAGTFHHTHEICTFRIPCMLVVLVMHTYIHLHILTCIYMLIRDSVQTEQIPTARRPRPNLVTPRYRTIDSQCRMYVARIHTWIPFRSSCVTFVERIGMGTTVCPTILMPSWWQKASGVSPRALESDLSSDTGQTDKVPQALWWEPRRH